MVAAGFVVPAPTAVDALRVPVRGPWRTLLPALGTGAAPVAKPEPTSVALQLTVTLVLYQRPYTGDGDVEHASVGAEVSTPTVTKGNDAQLVVGLVSCVGLKTSPSVRAQ